MDQVFQAAQLAEDQSAQDIVNYLQSNEEELGIEDGILYYDFPIFRDELDQVYRANLLLASKSHGIYIISLLDIVDRTFEEDQMKEADERLSKINRILFGMFLKSNLLVEGLRDVKPNMTSILFFPHLSSEDVDTTEIQSQTVFSRQALSEVLNENQQDEPLGEQEWAELRAILEGAKGLIRPKDREVPSDKPKGKAATLANLEQEIANFDLEQRRAALTIVEGPQRIRGLAGSGKTIILAYKAAHLHLNNPSADILFTFYTKSLYKFVKRLITRFFRHYIDRDPDWDRIHVQHGWGGRNLQGVYYNACANNNVKALPLNEAKKLDAENPFDAACSKLLETSSVKPKYDYVLIDEAQDFPPSFYRLCFELTRGEEYDRNVVWAYDELQNIFKIEIPSPQEAFGVDDSGTPVMDLDRASEASGGYGIHDIVLRKCYRNAQEILITAHALGFGLYSDTIVQMLQDEEHWEDVGYSVEEGDCVPGERVSILRPAENSPLGISDKEEKSELISHKSFSSMQDEIEWVIDNINEFLEEGLRPDDIMVISLDDRHARDYFEKIANRLIENGTPVHNVLDNPYGGDVFIKENHVTLTTVYRAKGNEAAVVFAVGIDALYPLRKSRIGRNRLFTAFTRAKAWLRVSGTDKEADFFLDEISEALDKSPRLEFVYPDPEEVDTLQRDLSDKFSKLDRVYRRLDQMDMLDDMEEYIRTMEKKKDVEE